MKRAAAAGCAVPHARRRRSSARDVVRSGSWRGPPSLSPAHCSHRGDDVRIGAAAAEVAAHQFADLVVGCRAWPSSMQARPPSRSGPACSSRTGSASCSMKACCSGCSASPSRQAFDGGDRRAPSLHHRQRQAGVDAPAVDQHGAGAALAVVAALLGAGQVAGARAAGRAAWSRPRVAPCAQRRSSGSEPCAPRRRCAPACSRWRWHPWGGTLSCSGGWRSRT